MVGGIMGGVIFITRVSLVLVLTSSCASLWPFGESKADSKLADDKLIAAPEVTSSEQVSSNPGSKVALPVKAYVKTNDDEITLKQARIMARMDEIENELKRQREKVRLLEQGLLTGIVPDDLKAGGSGKKHPKGSGHLSHKKITEDLFSADSTTEDLSAPNLEGVDVNTDKTSGPAETGASSALSTKMQIAKEHYQSSRFGLAIAELAGISRDFGDKAADGAVRLWLGKSYLGMKEYGTAREEFESYIKGWPKGEGVAAARIDLARVYVGLGLKERARGELRRVIKDFEGQEVSEIASHELKNLQGNL